MKCAFCDGDCIITDEGFDGKAIMITLTCEDCGVDWKGIKEINFQDIIAENGGIKLI